MGRKREDVTGQTFGRLTVLYYDREASSNNPKRNSMYVCKCSCGNTTDPISVTDLRRGHTRSCGCLLQETSSQNGKLSSKKDMVGKQFGKLTVTRIKDKSEYTDGNISKVIEWYCDCQCGTKDHVVAGTILRAGRIKSCGCLIREVAHNRFKDISGNKFGLLTAIQPIDEDYNNRKTGVKWFTKCDCGGNKIVPQNSLDSGTTISCGCIISKNEYRIRQILMDNNINYTPQYTFEDCRNPKTNRKLKFDFGVEDDNNNLLFLIEYDGEQHYLEQRYSSNPQVNKKRLEDSKWRDSLKDQYVTDHGIDLLRISYTQQDQLDTIIINKLKEVFGDGIPSKKS